MWQMKGGGRGERVMREGAYGRCQTAFLEAEEANRFFKWSIHGEELMRDSEMVVLQLKRYKNLAVDIQLMSGLLVTEVIGSKRPECSMAGNQMSLSKSLVKNAELKKRRGIFAV